jgi:hypothetical protein
LHQFPESDWKTFRELRDLALERFCKRALDDLASVLTKRSSRHHERYLEAYRLLRARDKELARAFDDPRRSRMLTQLLAIYAYGLLEPQELGRFTAQTRSTIEGLAKDLELL